MSVRGMFSQPARKRLQPARKRLQPVRKRLQPARKRLQLARKRLQSARKRLQPASQPQDWITAESREVSLGLLCKMHAQETASYARCCMCFAVQFFESTGGECSRNIPRCHRAPGGRTSCVEVFVFHAGIFQ